MKLIKGEAISWKYIGELNCIAIKRRYGVQYFASVHDLRTLPYWDVRAIVKKKLMGAERNGYVRHYVDMLVYEANTRWKNYRPQFPQRIVKHNEIEANGLPRVILKYKPPKTMTKIPMMKMEQDVCHNLRCWYYHSVTGEAVLVLAGKQRWRTIRILDPIWIVNMSKSDIECLFLNQLLYLPEDYDLAKQFIDVVSFCYAYEVHAGSDWESKFKQFGFVDPRFDTKA